MVKELLETVTVSAVCHGLPDNDHVKSVAVDSTSQSESSETVACHFLPKAVSH